MALRNRLRLRRTRCQRTAAGCRNECVDGTARPTLVLSLDVRAAELSPLPTRTNVPPLRRRSSATPIDKCSWWSHITSARDRRTRCS
jgi:hypothetical protein